MQRQPLDGKERLVCCRLILISVLVDEMNGNGAPKKFVKVFAAPPNIALQLHALPAQVELNDSKNQI